jgi:hypothetical protein
MRSAASIARLRAARQEAEAQLIEELQNTDPAVILELFRKAMAEEERIELLLIELSEQEPASDL